MMKEIPDFPNYFITENGEVWSAKRNIFLTPHNDRGYLTVNLSNNGIRQIKKIHRLVAEAFIPNPNNYPQINHKDENKLNNNVDNLEWCTQKYNCQYGTRNYRCTVHCNRKVKQLLNGEVINKYNSLKEASLKTNIKYQNISSCCRNQQNTAGGYEWKYC